MSSCESICEWYMSILRCFIKIYKPRTPTSGFKLKCFTLLSFNFLFPNTLKLVNANYRKFNHMHACFPHTRLFTDLYICMLSYFLIGERCMLWYPNTILLLTLSKFQRQNEKQINSLQYLYDHNDT